MKALPKVMLVCGVLSLVGYTAKAQAAHSACSGSGSFVFSMTLVNARPGCPFSGVIETERTQTLADGTNIHTKKKTAVFRDSLGRIRYEVYAATDINKDAPEAPTMIQVYDRVAGFRYEIHPQSGVAWRTRVKNAAASPTSTAQLKHSFAVKQIPNTVVEKLGTQEMEGILATGTRTTITIPVGADGNDRAITTVTETWNSPEMSLTLLEKISDPRYSNFERRIVNVMQSEPDSALFQVPADYTIQDE
jgi:hypothetical protein